MKQFITKVTTGAVSASILAFTILPAVYASTDVTVAENGADSTNGVTVDNSTKTKVEQKSSTYVTNIITTSSSTGGNEIKGTTGEGSPSITTGDATSTTSVTVTGGSNVAEVNPCGCENGDTTVDVLGNGTNTDNTVTVKNKKKLKVKQKAKTSVYSEIDTKSKTGKNKIKNTTGSGDATVETGEATSDTTVVVEGGSNGLNP